MCRLSRLWSQIRDQASPDFLRRLPLAAIAGFILGLGAGPDVGNSEPAIHVPEARLEALRPIPSDIPQPGLAPFSAFAPPSAARLEPASELRGWAIEWSAPAAPDPRTPAKRKAPPLKSRRNPGDSANGASAKNSESLRVTTNSPAKVEWEIRR